MRDERRAPTFELLAVVGVLTPAEQQAQVRALAAQVSDLRARIAALEGVR